MMFFLICLFLGVSATSILTTGDGAIQLDLSLSDDHIYYIDNLSLGTPAQPITNIIIDSGSSDLMIVQSIYNASASSSFVNTNQSFLMKYGFDDPFPVYQIYENIESQDFTLHNLTMGYADVSDMQSFSGILGIGFTTQELFGTNYPNFPYLLKDQGITQSVLYSFNGQDDNSAIIFGGLSTNIVDGPLVKVPFIKAIGLSGQLDYWLIPTFTVNEVKLGDIVISNQNTLYQIDSGTNGFLPPTPVLNNLLTLLGDDYIETDDGLAYYDIKNIEGKELKFNVQGYEIGFALSDIIGDTIEQNGTTYAVLNLASYNIGYDSYDGLLPNFIFKYFYSIFDYENYQVYFGKYKESSIKGNVVAVSAGNNLPYPTVDVPDSSNTYSVIYEDDKETTIATRSNSATSNIGSANSTTSEPSHFSTSQPITTTSIVNPKRCYKA